MHQTPGLAPNSSVYIDLLNFIPPSTGTGNASQKETSLWKMTQISLKNAPNSNVIPTRNIFSLMGVLSLLN